MNILFPFHDDSSLIFACTMGRELVARGVDVTYALVIERQDVGSKVSNRQLHLYLPEGPDIYLEPSDLVQHDLITAFDAIISCRLLKDVNNAVDSDRLKNMKGRACFVAFWAGLDLFPEKGVVNRRNYDIIYLPQAAHQKHLPANARAFHVDWGHPYFIPQAFPKGRSDGPILFATQSISPLTLAGRAHMTNLLVGCALANPDREIFIKLRHKTNENQNHAHKEAFAYEDIARDLYSRMPPNISFNDSSMAMALTGASGCFTCTSTAAMDAIAAGVPCLVYLDYPGASQDPLCAPMRTEFERSNLIGSTGQVLSLDFAEPDPQWMTKRFTTPVIYNRLLEQIDRFHISRNQKA